VYLELGEACEERTQCRVIILWEVDQWQAREGEGREHARDASAKEEKHIQDRREIISDKVEITRQRHNITEADGEGAEGWDSELGSSSNC
jgi:hypothetical protein